LVGLQQEVKPEEINSKQISRGGEEILVQGKKSGAPAWDVVKIAQNQGISLILPNFCPNI
jgi:hypothetical protein